MTHTTERRAHSRYPAQHLKVLARSLRHEDSSWKAGSISSVDFNRYGICLESHCNYPIGDILTLIIRTDDSTIAEVNGLICNRTQTTDGFRFGIQFEHHQQPTESSEAPLNISAEILMIEQQAAAHIH